MNPRIILKYSVLLTLLLICWSVFIRTVSNPPHGPGSGYYWLPFTTATVLVAVFLWRQLRKWGVFVVCSLFLFNSCTTVDSSEIGVLMTNYGKNGLVDYVPVYGVTMGDFTSSTQVYRFPGHSQNIDAPAYVFNTPDGEFSIDPSFTFTPNRNQGPLIISRYKNYTSRQEPLKDLGLEIFAPMLRDCARAFILGGRTDSIIYRQVKIESGIEARFRDSMALAGQDLNNVVLNFKFPESLRAMLQAKYEASAKTAQREAEIASAQASVKVKEAEAQELVVWARAQAEANRLEASSLSPLLIQKQFIEKWDGQSPLYGNNPVTLLKQQ